ncbi:uncharacterized protein LOC135491374 [Lineus longissimus]|uniref:uncharacterized protein LOC135491374 n=1 Tax=Lineus longissimus TaxID=88925 RepID=UPI002B4EE4DF
MEAHASGYRSPSGSQSDDPPSSCRRHSTKRGKGRSKGKVWEKVAWFTRKSKSREQSEHAALPDDLEAVLPVDMECDSSPTTPKDPPSIEHFVWSESSSSSELESPSIMQKSHSYPNSEIVDQSCLRPSMARALFQQIEAANLYPKVSKPPWQKRQSSSNGKKRNSAYEIRKEDYLNDNWNSHSREDLPMANSMPRHLDNSYIKQYIHKHCHCSFCCDCDQSVKTNVNALIGLGPLQAHSHSSTHVCSSRNGLCKKRPMAQGEADLACVCKKRSSFSSLEELYKREYNMETHSGLFNSLPHHFGASGRCVSVQRSGTTRSHLGLRSELFCNARQTVCNVKDHKDPCSNSDEVSCSNPSPKDKVSPEEFKNKLKSMKEWFKDFNDEQKNILLKEMLDDCELPQIHLLSIKMEPRLHEGCPPNCQDLISWMPITIALYILSYLDPVSLCRSSAVCCAWYQLANEPCLWQRFCYSVKWRLSRSGEQKQLLQHILPGGSIHWKEVFAERYRLRNNWLTGMCHVRTFEGHTQGISCVQFDDTRIVSGSSDKTIKVWNIRTNTPWSVQTLVGHSGTVRCLHLEGNRLVSGSTDTTIKVWDLSMQQSWSSIACKVTMIGHTDTVRCLQVDDEKIVSGSYDKTLKVWDMRTGDCRMTLRGHNGAVLCVQFDAEKIISGSSDNSIKVWNFEGLCVMSLSGHHDAVTCLQFDNTRIISGSLDCNLKFWDIVTGQCSNTIDWKASEGHTGVVRCLQADSWRVVSASDDKTLKVWNLETGKRLTTLKNHTDGVTCLQFNDSIIVSGSYDKTVKLWDFSCC